MRHIEVTISFLCVLYTSTKDMVYGNKSTRTAVLQYQAVYAYFCRENTADKMDTLLGNQIILITG